MVGTGGIRLGRLPRWVELLTKLAAITTRFGGAIAVGANASTWPGETSFSAAKDGQSAQNRPGASNEQHAPGGYR